MNSNLNFDYVWAKDIQDAISLLNKYGDEARIFAGGTELLVNIKQHAISPAVLIDINSISGLAYIKFEENNLKIGALTPLRMLENSVEIRDSYPSILEAVKSIGTVQIRNMGTVGGNICQTVKCPYYNQSHINLFMRQSIAPCRQRGGSICHAAKVDSWNHAILGKPVNGCVATTASDLSTPLMALGASVKAVGGKGDRIIPIEDFFLGGGMTALQENEIVVEVEIPFIPGKRVSKYEKYSHGTRNFSILNAAVLLWLSPDGRSCKDARIAMGGIRPVPFRLKSVERAITDTKDPLSQISGAFEDEMKGVRIRGEQSKYKRIRAETMITDIIHSLLQAH
jgi:xanthine dehydrogenase YagS FAD-binding subunit